ncbi:MAG: YeeE/YedE family protein [Defluviicoccus sp.]|nr:YeeE/YedE family protein [Defluviicoccus sp.]MDG4593281.1 YeeE/YedE family protein [Defluviicoccus sp.]MDS4072347.1 YeeE/YedE family protein [Defluviicoccus sp.]
MARLAAAFLAGLLFGAGLTVSAMISPAKVLAFLDVGAVVDGRWDPSLALVMAAALATTAIGYALVLRRKAPLLAPRFVLPTAKAIDTRLIGGALVFGLGWGLVGLCPGPALAGLAQGSEKTALFVAALIAGIGAHRLLRL